MSGLDRIDGFFLLRANGRFAGLDGVRGWAVAMVFSVHLLAFYGTNNYLLAPGHWLVPVMKALHAGWIGVDLFFVASGFLIARALAGRQTGFVDFMSQRLRRLLPAFWATQALVVLLLAALGRTPGPLELVVNMLFLDAFVAGVRPLNFVTWSLGYELAFYTSMALWSALARRTPSLRAPVAVGAVVVALYAAQGLSPLVTHLGLAMPDLARTGGFLFGIGLAKLVASPVWTRLGPVFARAALPAAAGLVALRFVAAVQSPFPQPHHTLFFLGVDACAAVLIGGVLVPGHLATRLFSLRPLRWLGAMSYSVYLVHGILALNAASRVVGVVPPNMRIVAHGVLGWALTLGLGALCWWLFERRYFTARTHPAPVPGTATP